MKKAINDMQNTVANLDSKDHDWRTFSFAFPKRKIRLGTSFSGIGAIEHAFKRLGLTTEIVFAGDIDENCKKAYFANYDISDDKWHKDIHELDATPYDGQVDLFVGGAPCQAFSQRGKHGGFDDTRGTLFREFARIVMECHPKVFIFENVKGMLSHDKGRTWETIHRTFVDDCGYDVHYQVLNSKNYGIPQSRDRIYCIGFQKETDFKFPHPISLERSILDLLETEIPNKYFLKEKGFKFITQTINHKKSYTQINGNIMLCQKRNQQFNWHGDFDFHPYTSSIRQNPDFLSMLHEIENGEERFFINENLSKYIIEPCRGECQVMIGKQKELDIPVTRGWFRKFTPRECLRLMGFDDSFKIVVSDTEAYKQSGNSIVVDVLMAILRQLDITKYGYDG